MYVGGARFGHGWDAQLAENMDAVGRYSDPNRCQVLGAKVREIMVAEVFLRRCQQETGHKTSICFLVETNNSGKVLRLVL